MSTLPKVDRYYLFVGCAVPDCDAAHGHHEGWDTLAATATDIDDIRAEVLKIPDHLWWHVVDIIGPKVIMRHADMKEPKH